MASQPPTSPNARKRQALQAFLARNTTKQAPNARGGALPTQKTLPGQRGRGLRAGRFARY